MNWQPTLAQSLVRLRPLVGEDFEPLFLIASDPLIWEQHPEPDRYTREKFLNYFRGAMESKGALAIFDNQTDQMIGCTRYLNYDASKSYVEIGYTFLTRDYWGKGHNREMKYLMLNYAFQFVDYVAFQVGEKNFRSQRAVQKIGGKETKREGTTIFYQMKKGDWKF